MILFTRLPGWVAPSRPRLGWASGAKRSEDHPDSKPPSASRQLRVRELFQLRETAQSYDVCRGSVAEGTGIPRPTGVLLLAPPTYAVSQKRRGE